MKYRLLYTKTAVKDIKKLDSVVKKKIKQKLETLSTDPIKHVKKIINSDLGSYRWRVGDYRIVFDLDKSTVIILRVGHRREIYK